MNIIALKMLSGEDIICALKIEDAESFQIENPASIIAQPTADGRGVSVGLAPYLPYSKEKNVKVYKHACAATFNPDKQLVNEYNRIFGSGIVIAGVGDIPR